MTAEFIRLIDGEYIAIKGIASISFTGTQYLLELDGSLERLNVREFHLISVEITE